jgi:hypothetical protein
MKFRNRQLMLLAVPLLAACSETTGPSRLVSITPASQSVVLQTTPTGKILRTSVTLTNTSAFPVTIVPCGIALEKKISGFILLAADGPSPPWYTVWVSICGYFSAEAVAILTAPLLPGQSVSVPIDVPVTQPGTLQFDGSPGEYRIHLSLTTQIVDAFHIIPHDLSVSDSFNVIAQ